MIENEKQIQDDVSNLRVNDKTNNLEIQKTTTTQEEEAIKKQIEEFFPNQYVVSILKTRSHTWYLIEINTNRCMLEFKTNYLYVSISIELELKEIFIKKIENFVKHFENIRYIKIVDDLNNAVLEILTNGMSICNKLNYLSETTEQDNKHNEKLMNLTLNEFCKKVYRIDDVNAQIRKLNDNFPNLLKNQKMTFRQCFKTVNNYIKSLIDINMMTENLINSQKSLNEFVKDITKSNILKYNKEVVKKVNSPLRRRLENAQAQIGTKWTEFVNGYQTKKKKLKQTHFYINATKKINFRKGGNIRRRKRRIKNKSIKIKQIKQQKLL